MEELVVPNHPLEGLLVPEKVSEATTKVEVGLSPQPQTMFVEPDIEFAMLVIFM
jgi:hypothetical protein